MILLILLTSLAVYTETYFVAALLFMIFQLVAAEAFLRGLKENER